MAAYGSRQVKPSGARGRWHQHPESGEQRQYGHSLNADQSTALSDDLEQSVRKLDRVRGG
jgi:hypothetical protein